MTELALYKLIFITELLVAEFLFAFRFPKRKYFVLRLIGGIILNYLVAYFFPLVSYSGWYSSLMFFTLFVVSYLSFIMFSFDTTFVNGFFISITAYTVQHLSYEIYALIGSCFDFTSVINMYGDTVFDLSNITNTTILVSLIYFELYFVIYWICYAFLAKRLVKEGEINLKNKNVLLLAVLILIVDILINAFVVYIDSNANSLYEIVICIYNILCCILVFYIQLSLVSAKKMKKEIETTQELLAQARKQYEISRGNISSINLKCHDLKYQIRAFAKSKIDDNYINEIENMISIYDANVKTGNEAIDIILTEKNLLCSKEGIKLTCMADCKKLSFIDDSDLYVLFGNAIDNAIEAVRKIENKEKRYIGFTVYSNNDLISINVNNFFEGHIKLNKEGLPITTKENKDYHGFGMKSIKMIVDKYNGDVSIVIKDDIFNLNIFIPIKK